MQSQVNIPAEVTKPELFTALTLAIEMITRPSDVENNNKRFKEITDVWLRYCDEWASQ